MFYRKSDLSHKGINQSAGVKGDHFKNQTTSVNSKVIPFVIVLCITGMHSEFVTAS